MPRVGIIMGSDSDLPVMKGACEVFDEFNIEYELTVCSAHRLPVETAEYASTAIEKGFDVIIAGAGGAAHLPGIIAAYTVLPVIGVPVRSKALSGVDSLYSIVQMPKGIPVATVAIDGSANAALLAVEIMAVKDKELQQNLWSYRRKMGEGVKAKDRKLKEIGVKEYLQSKEER